MAEEFNKFSIQQQLHAKGRHPQSIADLLIATVISNERELKDLRQQLMTIEEKLSPPHTLPTSMVAPLHVEVHDSKLPAWLVMVIALVLGGLGGAWTAWLKSQWLGFKPQQTR